MSVLVIFIITHLLSLRAIHTLAVKTGQLSGNIRMAFFLFWMRRNCPILNDSSPSTVFLLKKTTLNSISILIWIIFKVLLDNRLSFSVVFSFAKKTKGYPFYAWHFYLLNMANTSVLQVYNHYFRESCSFTVLTIKTTNTK